MPIDLIEIREAVKNYFETKLSVSVSTPIPDVPSTINPNEEFTFSVAVSNPDKNNGGIPILNVRFQLQMDNTSANLIVPSSGVGKATQVNHVSGLALMVGSKHKMFYLVGPDTTLSPGETITISGLKGKTGGITGSNAVNCTVYGDIDINYILGQNSSTDMVWKDINIV